MQKNEAFACLYFKRVAKIRKLENEAKRLRRRNKRLLKSNPWLGNLLGSSRKAKAEGSDSSASYSSSAEEEKEPPT